MSDSVYKIVELVGTSPESWEKAAAAAVAKAYETQKDLRVAEVTQMDMHIKDGKVEVFRTKIKVSFKCESKG
ncbi:MAG TPA: dodecin domain-containing protein [Gallionellaceae bacterium]